MGLIRRRGLLREYQLVEYIESHGQEYIDTGYAPSGSFEITSVTAFTTNETTGYVGILEAVSGGNLRCHYEASGSGTVYLNIWLGNISTYTARIRRDANFHTFYFSPASAKVDNTSGTPKNLSDFSLSFTLFARNRSGGAQNMAKCRQKDFIVKVGGAEIMHLRPCYRMSDGVIGMIDGVSGKFFTNDGGGAFTKGADI